MNTPSAPSVMEWPGMAREIFLPVFASATYLPMRGPSIAAPMKEVMPPTMWMAEEPAKSM
jgi:hypothetical protein